jgi:predicted kinase
MDRRFVVVSGLPGSGTTTLARRLAEELGLPLLDKDDILDRLFETIGIGDAAWRRRLSRESDAILKREALASNGGAVLTSLWRAPAMAADSGTPTHWLQDLSTPVVGVQCVCSPETAAKRFMERKRHAGHLDGHATYAEVLASLQALAAFGAVDVRPRIEVDTSASVSIDNVVGEIRSVFTRSLPCAAPDAAASLARGSGGR